MYTYPAFPTHSYPGLPCPYPYVIGCTPNPKGNDNDNNKSDKNTK